MNLFKVSALLLVSSVPGLCANIADASLLNGLTWRSIGPAVMGGRVSDIDAVPGDPAIVYVATGSGGAFRTTDGGITWSSIFDHEGTISIGALAIQPGNPKVVWIGTGESNVRNSVSFGDGLYKSEDGGATWNHVGLENTETISRIVINPANPDNVFVAAVGHPFGPNPERGVFVTQDGGKTWRKTLYLDNEHGAVGLAINPANPKILYTGMWKFDRKPWTYTSGDEKGGVFKSVDGGMTWQKLTNGLPKLLGRIGVKVAPSDPHTVYVIAESKEGTLFRSNDDGATFQRISDDPELVGRAYYFSDMRVAPDDPNHIMVLADGLMESSDGGQHFHRMSPGIHGDLHALWIDPKDPHRIWQGNDGGLAVTYDGGRHWEQVNNIPLGELYHVSIDNRRPFYNVTVGMQDDGSWNGPAETQEPAGIFNDDWRMVNPYTGMASLTDTEDPDVVLSETSGGNLIRMDLRTREQQIVSPQPQSFSGAPASEMKYRFNWDAPLVRSPFGKDTIYLAGNVVFQSSDYGKSWENISNDLTNHDASRMGNIGGPISIDNSASEVYSTITALAESPAKRNVIWAGTDDGNLQLTTNGGGEWTNVAAHLPGVPPQSPISHVEPSRTSEQTAYVSVDRHMFDDMRPYIFKTTDGGQSFVNISGNLPPKAFVWIVREDSRQPNLLYAGTELGLYASFTGGNNWVPLHLKNMPWSIAVRDIIFQPEKDDLIVATHGRSLWILDDATPLQQIAANNTETAQLFPVRSALRFTVRASRFGFGDKTFAGPNPPYGALISYYLPAKAAAVKLSIFDSSGVLVRNLDARSEAGVNRVAWDLRYAGAERREGRRGGERAGGRGGAPRGPQALPGQYIARLTIDGQTYEQKFVLQMDPSVNVSTADLQRQFEISRELIKMQTGVSTAVAKLSALRRDHPEQVEALLTQITRPANLRSAIGPRLSEDLGALFSMIDGANAAPTPAQMHYFDQLQATYRDVMQKVDALTGNAAPSPASQPH